jgi:hypothetical protein
LTSEAETITAQLYPKEEVLNHSEYEDDEPAFKLTDVTLHESTKPAITAEEKDIVCSFLIDNKDLFAKKFTDIHDYF